MTSRTELVALELRDLQATIRHLAPNLPSGISLRTADPETDLGTIADLYNAAFEREPSDRITAEKVAAYARHPGLGPSGVMLAFDGHLAVGMAVARLEVRASGSETRDGSVELLAVHPAYWGLGLATALTHRALSWLAGQGVKTVSATTDHPAALAILRRFGFQAVRGEARPAEHKAAEA
ncbi:MAG: GNAT family N-acetyltransferase [Anaerolineae bacterium]